jgi:hypothetical protein
LGRIPPRHTSTTLSDRWLSSKEAVYVINFLFDDVEWFGVALG